MNERGRPGGETSPGPRSSSLACWLVVGPPRRGPVAGDLADAAAARRPVATRRRRRRRRWRPRRSPPSSSGSSGRAAGTCRAASRRRSGRPVGRRRSPPPPPSFPVRPADRAGRAPGRLDLPGHAPGPGGGRASTRPDPLAFDMTLKPAPFEPTDRRFPINLATALRLSDARPLVVAAAQAGVWVAEAELTRAKVLWVPSLTFARRLPPPRRRRPRLQQGDHDRPQRQLLLCRRRPGPVHQPDRRHLRSRWRRGRCSTRGTGTSRPPRTTRSQRTADAYFLVHQYRGIYAGALYAVERGQDLFNRIKDLSEELVTRVEVDRARNLLADLEQRAASARQEWRVQSANLTQVLRLDPRAVVEPLEHDHAQVTLIDPARPLDDLMADRADQPPRAGLAQGAGRGGGGRRPPREGPPAPAGRPAQRIPDPRRHEHPGRDLRPRPQQQPQPVRRPRRRQHPAHLAARRVRDRQPGPDQGPARPAIAVDHRPPADPGHGRRRK